MNDVNGDEKKELTNVRFEIKVEYDPFDTRVERMPRNEGNRPCVNKKIVRGQRS